MTFDPSKHTTHPARAFSDFKLGEVFRAPSRTMTEGVLPPFRPQAATTTRSITTAPICSAWVIAT
ncbi:hypothetical protein SAMN05421850_101309 [Lutimaribacter saemankumensis]|uniref:Uncharacterized protein n=1 Tax=Lutimaribacter saemankumensis TaxID=490829 RepID=A0A1G8H157_9RHOB|nr:hypothetical protein SAMN05421850_101309 [Lutimaribacter saemankumensis]